MQFILVRRKAGLRWVVISVHDFFRKKRKIMRDKAICICFFYTCCGQLEVFDHTRVKNSISWSNLGDGDCTEFLTTSIAGFRTSKDLRLHLSSVRHNDLNLDICH